MTVRPQQSGTLKFTVQTKELDDFVNVNLNQTTYTLRPGAQVVADNLEQIETAGTLYKARGGLIFTQADIVRKGLNRVTNNEVYTVTWTVENYQNEVTDVIVKTISPLPVGAWIPESITPASQASAISYNQDTGEIVWTIGKLESYTGVRGGRDAITISFDLEAPRNNSGDLFSAPEITGIDVFTGETYSATGEAGRE